MMLILDQFQIFLKENDMKIKTSNLIPVIVVIIFSFVLGFYLLNKFFLALLYALLNGTLSYFVLKKNGKNKLLLKRIDSAYDFVNLMNIQMLTTSSLFEAYKSIENYLDNDFFNISNDNFFEQLQEISTDYNLNGFKMYVNSLSIYDSSGGNYKDIQDIPTSICQKTKVYYHKLYANKQIKLIEITSLYLLWLCVLLFLKISVPDFYKMMVSENMYSLLVLLLLVIGSITYYFAINNFFKNRIRGL